MAKKLKKEKEEESCKQLSESQTQALARLIINETESTDISRGINRNKKRRLPLAGSVMVF